MVVVQALMSYRADPSASNAKGESAISLVSAADMEDQPHFEQFKHCLTLRQVVLVSDRPPRSVCRIGLGTDRFDCLYLCINLQGEDILPDSIVNKIFNHEPLLPPPPPSDELETVATPLQGEVQGEYVA